MLGSPSGAVLEQVLSGGREVAVGFLRVDGSVESLSMILDRVT